VTDVLAAWPLRERAERLRQWPTLVDLVGRARALPGFAAFILIGSFAGGSPDSMSDVDSIVSIDDGAFDAAWARRSTLYGREPAFAWDVRLETDREVGAHKWLTQDLVLVECVLGTPTARARLADPYVVLAGDPARVETFDRVPPISRAELQAYVDQNRAEGHEQPTVQRAYEELVRAVRAVSRDELPPRPAPPDAAGEASR
jgi:hypothetical protein